MKKVTALIIVFVLVMSLAACGGDGGSSSSGGGDGLKIAIISSPSGVDDGSFNQDIYNGILKFIEENPDATVNAVREDSGDPTQAVNAVAEIVADYEVIVCCGYQFAGIGNIAKENPDTKFILIDTTPQADGQDVELANVYAALYAEQESGFYAGMAAALTTVTGKVAPVNGIAFPSNVNYQYGFQCGVKYVNETEGLNVEVVEIPSYAGTDVRGINVGGNYIGDFSDEATGKVVGNALIAEGVDIMFVAAGGSGNGVITAAKEASGVFIIGCDVDQFDDGVIGDRNVILTCGLKVMHATVYNALNTVKNDSFSGANVVLGADTDSTGYVSATGRHQLSSDTISKINAAQAKIKSGEIIPAANFNDITPDTFTW